MLHRDKESPFSTADSRIRDGEGISRPGRLPQDTAASHTASKTVTTITGGMQADSSGCFFAGSFPGGLIVDIIKGNSTKT